MKGGADVRLLGEDTIAGSKQHGIVNVTTWLKAGRRAGGTADALSTWRSSDGTGDWARVVVLAYAGVVVTLVVVFAVFLAAQRVLR